MPTSKDSGPDSALHTLTASEIAPWLKSGQISVETYLHKLLEQSDMHSGRLNAFITIDRVQVLRAARAADERLKQGDDPGPLFGVPISLKDLIMTKGLTSTLGTKKFAQFIPARNAAIVDTLQAAGAIIFGKNNMQEMAYGSNGYNSHYGQQLNPYDENHIAGGSSGGSAAAVAARILPIAIGSDTAASIRVPAAYTGLYGFRPSTGRYDTRGVSPVAPTLDTVGPMTRSADDLMLIDAVLADDKRKTVDMDLKDIRLGVPKAYFHQGVGREVMSAFNVFLDKLERAGVALVEADLPDTEALTEAGIYPILFHETYPSIRSFLQEWGGETDISGLYDSLGWDVKALWDQMVMPGAPEAIPKAVYDTAVNQARPDLQKGYQDYFRRHRVTAIIFPATAGPAPLAKPDNPQEIVIDDESVSIFINDHNSSPGALAGQPGVVIPVTMNSEGLPLAVSLDGPREKDRQLLALTTALSALIAPLPAPPVR